jgi:hypothetical protein
VVKTKVETLGIAGPLSIEIAVKSVKELKITPGYQIYQGSWAIQNAKVLLALSIVNHPRWIKSRNLKGRFYRIERSRKQTNMGSKGMYFYNLIYAICFLKSSSASRGIHGYFVLNPLFLIF